MKFIHTADIHLGATFVDKNDIFESFEKIIEVAGKEKADVLLISGDLFHKQPLLRELREVNQLFSKISNTRVFIIAGNHDYIQGDSYYNTFVWNHNVTFIKEEKLTKVDVDELNLSIYGMSYHSREIKECIYDNIEPEDRSRINILMAHGGDETHGPISVQRLKENGFDYIALGHIHKPLELIKNYAIFPGSIEPLDINETGEHGYIYGEISKSERLIEFRSIAKKRCIHYELDITGAESNYSIVEKIKGLIEENTYYKIILVGKTGLEINMGLLYNIKNVVKVLDNTSFDFNLDEILRENENGIIGQYISRYMVNTKEQGAVEKKANEYALKALVANQKGN